MQDELDAWLTLLRAPGLGGTQLRRLVQASDSARAVCANLRRGAGRIDPAIAAALRRPDRERLSRDRAWLSQPDRHLITCLDERFPLRLAAAEGAPAALWVLGNPGALASPQIAVVGSRAPTRGGAETAHAFAASLAERGLTVTSGLATGIDTAAHEGALAADGETIAVLGCGIDRCYPAGNRGLHRRILERAGAVVAEYPPGVPPARGRFPARNRIIAGLSLGVLVVEASERSGSLITTRIAGDLGRDVFAVPGSIHNPLTRGCHRLIKSGAKLVESADDVLVELAGSLEEWLRPPVAPARPSPEAALLEPDDEYGKLLNALGFEPTTVDRLQARTGLTTEVLSSMLLVLELDGTVEMLPGGSFARVPRR